MRAIPRFVAASSFACLAAFAVVAASGSAFAQDKAADASQQAAKEIALTDKQVEGVIAAEPEVDAVIAKLPEGTEPDPKAIAQLDGIAKKHGFANYAEYDDVSANISLVMDGYDPQTKKYVGQEAVLKEEIADVQGDKKMSPKDKKEALDQLNESLKSAKPLQFPANVQVVSKYFDKLSESMQKDQ